MYSICMYNALYMYDMPVGLHYIVHSIQWIRCVEWASGHGQLAMGHIHAQWWDRRAVFVEFEKRIKLYLVSVLHTPRRTDSPTSPVRLSHLLLLLAFALIISFCFFRLSVSVSISVFLSVCCIYCQISFVAELEF